MNLFKSIFISLYLTLMSVGSLRAIWLMSDAVTRLQGSWILLALLPAVGFFAWVFTFNVARTGRASVVMWGPGVVALTGAAITGALNTEATFWIVGVGLVGALVYIRWYSRFGGRNDSVLQVGAKLPPLNLNDEQGNPVNTADMGAPLLLLFYRGNWCPLCMAQIREVAARYQDLEKRGVQVLAISPQPETHSADLAKRFQVNIRFCVDRDNRVARQLGIFAKNGLPMGLQALGYDSDTVMPTVVMTDANGQILFADLTDNYRVRPEPDQFLAIFDQAGVL